jgi:hypothetical protein
MVPDAPSMPSLELVEVIVPLPVMLRGEELRIYGPIIALLIVVAMFVIPLGVSQGSVCFRNPTLE